MIQVIKQRCIKWSRLIIDVIGGDIFFIDTGNDLVAITIGFCTDIVLILVIYKIGNKSNDDHCNHNYKPVVSKEFRHCNPPLKIFLNYSQYRLKKQ